MKAQMTKRAAPGAETPNAALTKVPAKEATVATLDLTKKLIVYDTLCKLNQACSEIITGCRGLEELNVFNPENLLFFRGFIRELQSGLNHEIMNGMQQIEEHDWFQFGKFRTIWEKRQKPQA